MESSTSGTGMYLWKREDSSEYSNSKFINYISRYLKISSTTYIDIVIDWLCLTILFCKWRRRILITEAWYTYQEYTTTNCLVNFSKVSLITSYTAFIWSKIRILKFCKNGAVDFQMIPETERLLASNLLSLGLQEKWIDFYKQWMHNKYSLL